MSGHGGRTGGAMPSRGAAGWPAARALRGSKCAACPAWPGFVSQRRRNDAMLLLIASYGLRGCEVRALRVNDIDGRTTRSSSSRQDQRRRVLPLTRPAGEAVLDCLLAGRPLSRHREVFLSSRPPHRPLRTRSTPGRDASWTRRASWTAARGAHILRHSLAVRLLRSGETLKSTGDLPGHRRPDTTFIYTSFRRRSSQRRAGPGGGVGWRGPLCGLWPVTRRLAATLEASATPARPP